MIMACRNWSSTLKNGTEDEARFQNRGDVVAIDRACGTGSAFGICMGSGTQDSQGRARNRAVRTRNGQYRVRTGGGERIQLAVSKRDGPDGVAYSHLSLVGGGSIQGFRSFYGQVFFRGGISQRSFLIGGVHTHLSRGKADRRAGWGDVGGGAAGALFPSPPRLLVDGLSAGVFA